MNYCTIPYNQDLSTSISLFIVSLGLTVLAYCAFPLIYAKSRKIAIHKKKYTRLCYGINFLVMLVFVIINGSSSGAPYLLWTWVFSKSGLKTLKQRGLLEETHNDRSTVDSDVTPHGGDIAPPTHSFPDFDKMPPDEAMNSILQMQTKNTIEAMDANSKNQPDNEGDADFGLVPEKPIFTLALKSVDGEKEYLDELYALNGERIAYNRLGSTHVNGINGMIDIYETFLPSGQPYKTIYINMYGAKQSTKAPIGFSIGKPVIYQSLQQEHPVSPYPIDTPQKNTPKPLIQCGSKVGKNKIWSLLILAAIITSISLNAFQYSSYKNNIATVNEQLEAANNTITSLEKEVASQKRSINLKQKEIDSQKSKISSLEKKASYYDAIIRGMQFGNTGYASSNFFASDSVIVVSKNEVNRKFKLTANWSNGGTVYVDYSSNAAVVSFDNDEWSTSTQMTVHPLSEGVTIATFSNSVNSKTFKVLIIVTA